ncbi:MULTISPECIES: phospholipase A [unclassified Methylophaga]|jgi:phospholipase A1|uniref:phospholipase A n=1 Tax=unclassified Methylophaga TaxID=2629249 RepID=UPI000C977260|nr:MULTISPECIES: phospholipase A [unclassified Methylophaga]MAK66209.1 phospholipase [Methylophaga sp.]MAY17404.1 phospholipase [Methylophaga sp.]MBN47346.1 phospholipase [Methylophaga sp.]HCD04799.1 phospholipase [Methylophaga sp.]|tara:strand:- start:7350 stop:8414 length:1065 start_codon:yes stop_codon:yes gene_type:complete
MKRWFVGVLLAPFFANVAYADQAMDACILSKMATSDDSVTVGNIREICSADIAAEKKEQEQPAYLSEMNDEQLEAISIDENEGTIETADGSALSRRLVLEKTQSNNPFAFLPHRPNYFIFSNNVGSANEAPFDAADPDRDYDFQPWESKFQISLKLPVVRGLFDGRADAFIAYTNRSFWQMFNSDSSAAFRDSNHEPEAWLSFANDTELLGFKNSLINVGINHQSNGQSGELSRSWNRVFAEFVVEKGDFYFSARPWYRIPERSSSDDNPDIEKYLGNFDFTSVYKYGDHSFDLMIRNNLRGNNKGATQLGWSFPLYKNFRGYVQWFNGYGESLIDYDHRTNSIGFGIQFSDWL